MNKVVKRSQIEEALSECGIQARRVRKMDMLLTVMIVIGMGLFQHIGIGGVMKKMARGMRLLWGDGGYEVAGDSAISTRRYQLGSEVFQKGQAAMIIQNASRIPAFNTANVNYDIAPLPLPWSGKRTNQAGGARWLMNAKGKNKAATWTFMTFLNSADGGNGIYAKTGSMFPAQKSVATSKAFTDPSQKPANRSAFATEGAGLAILSPDLVLPAWEDIANNIISPAFGKVWALEDTPDKFAAAVCPAVNDALKKAGFPKWV